MKYDWREAGEEWSAPWGSSAAQWTGTIFPRIRNCLPTGTILEIAPGFGRWTHYLKDYCEQLWIVDRSSECIEACRRRVTADSHVRCYPNDGRSLSLLIAVRAPRFSPAECDESGPKSKFHARSRANSTPAADPRLEQFRKYCSHRTVAGSSRRCSSHG